jgi:hypothetical protein
VPVGAHTVQLANPYFETETRHVFVLHGETTSLRVDLRNRRAAPRKGAP